jgi:hypothetical protein
MQNTQEYTPSALTKRSQGTPVANIRTMVAVKTLENRFNFMTTSVDLHL